MNPSVLQHPGLTAVVRSKEFKALYDFATAVSGSLLQDNVGTLLQINFNPMIVRAGPTEQYPTTFTPRILLDDGEQREFVEMLRKLSGDALSQRSLRGADTQKPKVTLDTKAEEVPSWLAKNTEYLGNLAARFRQWWNPGPREDPEFERVQKLLQPSEWERFELLVEEAPSAQAVQEVLEEVKQATKTIDDFLEKWKVGKDQDLYSDVKTKVAELLNKFVRDALAPRLAALAGQNGTLAITSANRALIMTLLNKIVDAASSPGGGSVVDPEQTAFVYNWNNAEDFEERMRVLYVPSLLSAVFMMIDNITSTTSLFADDSSLWKVVVAGGKMGWLGTKVALLTKLNLTHNNNIKASRYPRPESSVRGRERDISQVCQEIAARYPKRTGSRYAPYYARGPSGSIRPV